MRQPALPTALFVLAVLYAPFAFTACQASGRAEPEADPAPRAGHDSTTYLDQGACAGPGPAFPELGCTDRRAVARVLARHNGPEEGGPLCPETTDFVLHLAAVNRGTSERDSAPEGYACLRNLRPPHPGDPGMGGGPRTVVGDCVYGTERPGVVKKTACDGSLPHAPEYRITDKALTREDCPASTDLYVQIGGEAPIGCARRLT